MTVPTGRLVTVVEDEETIREIVSSMLGGAHFQTRQASSGVEALAILESGEQFDLVLSDLMMAEMEGLDSTRLLKTITELPLEKSCRTTSASCSKGSIRS